MSTIYALNGISYLAVSLIAFYMYYSFCKKEEIACKVGTIFAVNGIFYLLMSFLNFSWVFGFLEANSHDFALINMALTVVSSILVLYAVYKITENKNLIYLLILFITTIFAINFSISAFLLATLGASYMLMAIVFLSIAFSNYYLKRAGIAGLFYVAASIALLGFMIFGYASHTLFWFVPNAIMFIVLVMVYLDVSNLGIVKRAAKKREPNIFSYAIVLIKFFMFITSISVFVFISTIAVHELGHALVAQYYGCGQFKAVIYDIIAPHTEIRCEVYYNNTILTYAGLAATLAIGIVFMLTGSGFTKGLSYLLFGFGLLVSYGDLVDIGVSKNMIALVIFLSLTIIAISVIKISSNYLKQQEVFRDIHEKKPAEGEVKKILKHGVAEKGKND